MSSPTVVFKTGDPSSAYRTTFLEVDTTGDGGDDNYLFQTWLYADPAFDNWVNDFGSNPSETDKTLRDDYSNYALRIKCDITSIDGTDNTAATRVWNGCCIQDKS